jgi:choline dehydrogenase
MSHSNLAKLKKPRNEYDFIVVGAGSAGSVVSSRLSELKQFTVLLLEAGTNENITSQTPSARAILPGSKYDWGYITESQNNSFIKTGINGTRAKWVAGKALGGSSSVNGMIYLRGAPNDYNLWEQNGIADWSYENVLPYFLKSENNTDPELNNPFHSSNGPLCVSTNAKSYFHPVVNTTLNAFIELGVPKQDLNSNYIYGSNFVQQIICDGRRGSAAKGFLEGIYDERENLDVIANAYVTKINFDDNKQAISVSYVRDSQHFTVRVRKEIILSAGAVKTPQILMLSGIGPQEHLNKFNLPVVVNLEGVGQNLQDHVGAVAQFHNLDMSESDKDVCNEYLFNRTGPLSHQDFTYGFVNSSLNSDKSWPDIQIETQLYSLKPYFVPTSHSNSIYDILYHPLFSAKVKSDVNKLAIIVVPLVARPESRGYLQLRSADPFEQPIIQPNYLTHQNDVKTIIDGMKWGYRLLQTDAYAAFSISAFDYKVEDCMNNYTLHNDTLFSQMKIPNDEYLECVARHITFVGLHYSGTCKMGLEGDPMAVVNSRLQVFGVKRLRIADASIMPNITTANTNAPTIMIGERAAQFIIEDHFNNNALSFNYFSSYWHFTFVCNIFIMYFG